MGQNTRDQQGAVVFFAIRKYSDGVSVDVEVDDGTLYLTHTKGEAFPMAHTQCSHPPAPLPASAIPETVSVVGWRAESSGGFDWYTTEAAAETAFKEEQANVRVFQAEGWTAYRFDVALPEPMDGDAVTAYIDDQLDHYLDTAPRAFSPADLPLLC